MIYFVFYPYYLNNPGEVELMFALRPKVDLMTVINVFFACLIAVFVLIFCYPGTSSDDGSDVGLNESNDLFLAHDVVRQKQVFFVTGFR